MNKTINLEQAYTFVAHVRSGFHTPTTQRVVGCCGSIVFKRIQELENTLGVRLISRPAKGYNAHHKARITAAGEQFVKDIEPFFEILPKIEHRAKIAATSKNTAA